MSNNHGGDSNIASHAFEELTCNRNYMVFVSGTVNETRITLDTIHYFSSNVAAQGFVRSCRKREKGVAITIIEAQLVKETA